MKKEEVDYIENFITDHCFVPKHGLPIVFKWQTDELIRELRQLQGS